MHVDQINKIPEGVCYVIFTQDSTHIPGDERSMTSPGHGYPASTMYHPSVQVFTVRGQWEEAIKKQVASSRREFKAFIMHPATVTTEVQIKSSG